MARWFRERQTPDLADWARFLLASLELSEVEFCFYNTIYSHCSCLYSGVCTGTSDLNAGGYSLRYISIIIS